MCVSGPARDVLRSPFRSSVGPQTAAHFVRDNKASPHETINQRQQNTKHDGQGRTLTETAERPQIDLSGLAAAPPVHHHVSHFVRQYSHKQDRPVYENFEEY
mmetsp:Transcript_35651/g.80077  ORF Transcript_35651/g.80077 Transcript_35651/m.80077 type:complete len:102 (+) Transcript_35651:3102-3407(+)